MPTGIRYAELDSTGKIPAGQAPRLEDLKTALAAGEEVQSDGAGLMQVKLRAYDERNTTLSTSSSGFTTYLQLVKSNVPTGRYRVSWHYVFSNSATNSSTQVRVEIPAGSTVGPIQQLNEPNFQGHTSEELRNSNNVIECSGEKEIELSTGTPGNLLIRIAFAEVGSGTASMYDGAIRLEQVN